MFRMTRIRTRLLVIILLLLFISLGVVSSLTYYYANRFLSDSLDETALALSSDYAHQVQSDISEMIIQLEDLAAIQRMQSTDKAVLQGVLVEAHKRIGKFDAINYIFPDGSTVRSDGTNANVGDREYFQKVVQTKKPYVSEPLLSRATGKMAVILAVPVINDNRLIAVLSGNLPLERATGLIKDVKFKETGYAFLADDNGLVIAHPKRAELVGKLNLSEKKIAPEVKAVTSELDSRLLQMFSVAKTGKPALGKYLATDGVERVGVFSPFDLDGGQRWVIVVSAPVAETTREVAALTRIIMIVSGICILLAALVVVFIANRFASPIVRMRDEAILLAQGDFKPRRLQVDSQDEIGQLAKAFQEMAEKLRSLLLRVQSQADTVASASEELMSSAHQSAEASEQVAKSITEIAKGVGTQTTAVSSMSAVVEEMSASIEQIAATGKVIADIAAGTSGSTAQGQESIDQALGQMEQIDRSSEAVKQGIAELANGSREIGEIVTLISSIAGQTNLLALNAAIEAARAGEHGRGFAVVAEEVRKLAEDSNQAAQRIGQLIKKNEADMKTAVEATQTSSNAVASGISVVGQAGETFKKIARGRRGSKTICTGSGYFRVY